MRSDRWRADDRSMEIISIHPTGSIHPPVLRQRPRPIPPRMALALLLSIVALLVALLVLPRPVAPAAPSPTRSVPGTTASLTPSPHS